MRPSATDETRVLLDESSFDFRGVEDEKVELGLDHLVAVVSALCADDLPVSKSSLIYEIECRDGIEVHDLLFQRGVACLSPDIQLRAAIALDRMTNWDEFAACPETLTPSVDGRGNATLAPSVGHALDRASEDKTHAACLTFQGDVARGFREVKSDQANAQVFFFQDHDEMFVFWRGLFELENVGEQQFFSVAHRAFPGLILHHGLNFRMFAGEYRYLRDQVVQVLSVLNDHFARILQHHRGVRVAVQAELSALGLDCSPESPQTRSRSQVMELRDVEWRGESYRCEWHAKLDRTRNRIHFSLPLPCLDGRVLIGIFHEHLKT